MDGESLLARGKKQVNTQEVGFVSEYHQQLIDTALSSTSRVKLV